MSHLEDRRPSAVEINGQLCLNYAGIARWLYEMDEEDGREMSQTRPDLWLLVLAYQEKVRARLLIQPDLDDAIAATFDLERFDLEIGEYGAEAPVVALRRISAGRAS